MSVLKKKKAKDSKSCGLKGKIKFENDKNRLEATKLVNKIKYLEKNKFDIDSIKK